MPPSDFQANQLSPESSGDAGGLSHAQANFHVEGQLSQPADISQAHQFFQPQVDSSLLSPVSIQGETAVSAAGPLGGTEHAALSIGPGAEHAVMGAIPPGGEPVSPLIQLIMKLPGLTGVMNSFFEFLGALLHGDIMQAFDPAIWAQHAAGALGSATGDHFQVSISLLPPQAPILHPLGNLLGSGLAPGSLTNGLPSDWGSTGLAGVPGESLNISSPVNMQKPVFEDSLLNNYSLKDYPQDSMFRHFGQPENIAISPEAPVYRPTMGGFYQPPQATGTAGTPAAGASSPASTPQVHHASAAQQGNHGLHHLKHHLKSHEVAVHASHSPPDVQQTAAATDAPSSQYTVQAGDNLWDIARRNLGDGSRWHEIYNMNANVLGANPDLIHPGTTLELPSSGSDIASSASGAGHYVVQPGDNLWDIARHHLGGGQNWGEIYRLNAGVIGDNPALIHPGQQLNLSADTSQIAAAPESMPADVPHQPSLPAHSGGQALAQAPAAGQALEPHMDTGAQMPATSPSSFGSPSTYPAAAPQNMPAQQPQADPASGVYQASDGQLFFRKQQL